jgi:hypothetical protein
VLLHRLGLKFVKKSKSRECIKYFLATTQTKLSTKPLKQQSNEQSNILQWHTLSDRVSATIVRQLLYTT